LKPVIYLYVWSGDANQALELVRGRYAGLAVQEFPHRKLRESGLLGRLAILRGFHGRSLVFFTESLDSFRYQALIECLHLLHRCRETVLCDGAGRWKSMRTADVLRRLPKIAYALMLDGATFAWWACSLKLRLLFARPVAAQNSGQHEMAYLVPSFASMGSSGGAISHIRGFLYGFRKLGGACRVFTGSPLEQTAFPNELLPAARRPHVFWEARMLASNWTFAREVEKLLGESRPATLYQRHCPFAITGALLSSRLKIPLILEYNGPFGWISDHWDPTPFRKWIVWCEEVSLRSAARIIVVSEVLKDELLGRGIKPERIRVNPNGVDPDLFQSGPRRSSGRAKLNVSAEEILVGFAGSFSLWHGIEVLEHAIAALLSRPGPARVRFVLLGSGLLHGQMRTSLAAYETAGLVHFTGSVASDEVVEYLDACDILVSPHIPMPDGSRFFGSPTKLFEYMAMGKAIVASRLEQLGEVLEHDRTAWLVEPGSPEALAEAIEALALDAAKRERLGLAARQTAVERHSWIKNVAWALSDLPTQTNAHMAVLRAPSEASSLR
jgi:glycosyltransferase involved in cell wall biosynthesis